MSEYTKGRWKAINTEVTHPESGYALAEAMGVRWVPSLNDWECDDHHTAKANALLMAAAPELLEALKAMLDLISESKGWGTHPRMEGSDLYAEAYKAREMAEAAIAKAEGR